MVAFSSAAVKELLSELYEPETRTKLVAEYVAALGAAKMLTPERIEELAALSTIDGFKLKKQELQEIAAPYIAKAYAAEGRRELVAEATDLASEKVIKPVAEYTSGKVAAVKEATKGYASDKLEAAKGLANERVLQPTNVFAEPYINKSMEIAAPYIAKIESKRAEIVASKRYEKAVAALKQAREHPLAMASDLKSKAIDLLKYDNVSSYRAYIQSEEFQSDTVRLIKVDLPAIATDAASRGIEHVRAGATTVAKEIENKRDQIKVAWERGYSTARKIELTDLKDKMKSLLAELQTEAAGGYQEAKTAGFSFQDALARIKKMVGAIDTILITPLLSENDQDVPNAEEKDKSEDPELISTGNAVVPADELDGEQVVPDAEEVDEADDGEREVDVEDKENTTEDMRNAVEVD
ncbi:hypothetical protein AB1Y20_009711 [Prymnesium parvum]|uniref:Uncharacterized protein n=1 Tax=Prymnesium parvum TaxID=97485 RepID=A0AB34K535_PRYPA